MEAGDVSHRIVGSCRGLDGLVVIRAGRFAAHICELTALSQTDRTTRPRRRRRHGNNVVTHRPKRLHVPVLADPGLAWNAQDLCEYAMLSDFVLLNLAHDQ